MVATLPRTHSGFREDITRSYSKRFGRADEADFALLILPEEELEIIDNTHAIMSQLRVGRQPPNTRGLGVEDYYLIAQCNFIVNETPNDAEYYNDHHVLDMEHFLRLQQPWVIEETRLLTARLDRKPTGHELHEDSLKHKNGLRFRVYYCHKFPDKVKAPDD